MGFATEGTSLHAYRQSLAGIGTLDRETERQLAARWKRGDKNAADKIVRACLPFVVAVALEYRRWGIPLEDIIQQGNVGLLRAAAKFDPDRDCRLATYAVYWIRAEIREYVVRGYRVVRLGTTKAERRALRAYRTMHETDPEKLAAISGLSLEKTLLLLPLLAARETSLDSSPREDAPAVIDRLAAPGPSPEDEAKNNQRSARAKIAVSDALKHLDDREQLIVRERMMAEEPVTLERLGKVLGVSKERVRQLEERARGKLRESLAELREVA